VHLTHCGALSVPSNNSASLYILKYFFNQIDLCSAKLILVLVTIILVPVLAEDRKWAGNRRCGKRLRLTYKANCIPPADKCENEGDVDEPSPKSKSVYFCYIFTSYMGS